MKILLDINVLLDLYLARLPWLGDAKAIVQYVVSGSLQGYVASATFPTLYYICRRTTNAHQANRVILRTLQVFEVIPVTRATIESATQLGGKDFEDDLQIASAISGGVDAIVTRDHAGFAHSAIPVLSPADLLTRLGVP